MGSGRARRGTARRRHSRRRLRPCLRPKTPRHHRLPTSRLRPPTPLHHRPTTMARSLMTFTRRQDASSASLRPPWPHIAPVWPPTGGNRRPSASPPPTSGGHPPSKLRRVVAGKQQAAASAKFRAAAGFGARETLTAPPFCPRPLPDLGRKAAEAQAQDPDAPARAPPPLEGCFAKKPEVIDYLRFGPITYLIVPVFIFIGL
ncbi:hypothetical protein BRADI_1g39305v3 [Brachypodium distachyon]|uniref:Uncharacterized protein n=1 Tax=Brachypodium distachyon TaxID=15368 RepID=A0A2K2DNK8_BRADI|nr:hypothetical protein BRADI_1g39305v3 [Brachypodium distachyon]